MQHYLAIIAEPQCIDFEHAKVNAALITALCLAFPQERFLFVAQPNHLVEVKKSLSEAEVGNLDLAASPVAGRSLSQVRRLLPDAVFLAGVFRRAFGCRSKVILLLSVGSSILMMTKLLAAVSPGVRVLGVPHSVLASIVAPTPRRLIDRMFQFRTSLELPGNSRVNYLILGESILDQLESVLPALKPACRLLDLPYAFPAPDPGPPVTDMVFGFLGVAQNQKGFDKFLRLARDTNESRTEGHMVRFLCAGGNPHYEFKLNELEGIEIPFAGQYVPEEDFQCLCKGITYAVLPYDRDSYRFYPSGAVFDAFSHLKPIVCLRNPYFEYLFSRLGDIGYLCDDYDELRQTVAALVADFPHERYRAQQLNISSGREHFSPSGIKGRLKEIICKIAGRPC